MKRRDFLKASAVAAGVTLLESCARREVEYLRQGVERSLALPGVPVWRKGVCRQCPAGCGIQVRIVDGDAKKIEGNPDHPVNRGGLCALGQSSLQELYNPDRIQTPLKRQGPRGEGRFEAISWEEALRQVGEALARTEGSRMALVSGTPGGFLGVLWKRFAAALGAPAPAFLEALEVEVERRAARLALGIQGLPAYDIERSDYVLSIGSAFLDRWRSPVHYAWALAEMRRGRPGRRGKLVQAEARMSLTAANADEWLPVLPGSEGSLALALAGVILEDGMATEDGAAAYSRLLPQAPPTVEEAAEICALPPEKIRRIARELARAERGVVVTGGSAAGHTNGLSNVVAGLGLNLLLGSVGREGGVFSPASFALEEVLEPEPSSPTPMADVAARLRQEAGVPVELLVVAEADPVHTLPRTWGSFDGMAGVETIVALSSFLDDTTRLADLVLPVLTDLERYDAVEPLASTGVRVLGLARPVLEPVTEGRHPGNLILALAQVLGEPVAGLFPWHSYSALVETRIAEELARLPGGEGARSLRYIEAAFSRGGIWDEEGPQEVPAGPADGTSVEPEPPRFDGDPEHYPFQLQLFESVKTADGRGANRPWLQELPDPLTTVMWQSWVELSPADGERLGIRTGDRVRVESPVGAVEVGAVVLPAVRPGLVAVPLGGGYSDFGRYARQRGVNPMELVRSDRVVAGTAAPVWAGTRVRIERLGPGRLALYGRGLRQTEEISRGWQAHSGRGDPDPEDRG